MTDFESCASNADPNKIHERKFKLRVTAPPTKSDNLAKIPGSSVVVDSVSSGTRTHLLCAHTQGVDMRPPPFGFFTVCPGRELEKIERKSKLAFVAVTIDMEFRDNILNPDKDDGWNPHPGRELRDATLEVSAPLARDIV
jgi:hypothetical protein